MELFGKIWTRSLNSRIPSYGKPLTMYSCMTRLILPLMGSRLIFRVEQGSSRSGRSNYSAWREQCSEIRLSWCLTKQLPMWIRKLTHLFRRLWEVLALLRQRLSLLHTDLTQFWTTIWLWSSIKERWWRVDPRRSSWKMTKVYFLRWSVPKRKMIIKIYWLNS